MTEVDISLLLAALIVAAVSWKNPRGILWIGVAALSYINATIAWRLSLPYAEAITGIGDTAVCLCVYFAARFRWELWIWRLFQASLGVSVVYLAANIHVVPPIDHTFYSVVLEGINWLLLLLIGGVSAGQWIGAANARALRPRRYVLPAFLALRASRKTDHFLSRAR